MNSAYSRLVGPPSGKAADANEAPATGRVGATSVSASSGLANASPSMGFMARGNSISLESLARKRPMDSLSPLPSPLLSFLSTPPAAVAPTAMGQLHLSSRVGLGSGYIGGDRSLQATAVGNNSLKFVVPSGAKRLRREAPTSPRFVGEMSATRPSGSTRVGATLPLTAPAPTASSDKIRSVVRGLEHVSRCMPDGCGNPLCVSTRTFMNKVSAHLVAMANKPGHVADKCGACQLWQSIVRSHTSICMEANCTIPLCGSGDKDAVVATGTSPVEPHTGCRRRDRRDDNDEQRHPLVAQQ